MIRIATRGSRLALWQANWVKDRLGALGHAADLVIVETQGDREQRAFAAMEGQGFFTKAVQDAVLEGRADLAVHSHKDLPSLSPAGLEIAAIPERADPRDVLVLRPEARSEAAPLPLKRGARVGTSAVRRRKQLLAVRPDLSVLELRGNVPTRLERLRAGDYDAIVLAAAGLERLGLETPDLLQVPLSPTLMVPAPAQGALALETRRDAYAVASLLTELHHAPTYRCVAAERGLMGMLQGGCQLALGAHASLTGGQVALAAWYEGHFVSVQHPSSEGAAMLAFQALGRPARTA
jgi:hydroxymethylbilane synthase